MRYKPLNYDTDEIRLIKLHPRPSYISNVHPCSGLQDSQDDLVCCTVEHYPLSTQDASLPKLNRQTSEWFARSTIAPVDNAIAVNQTDKVRPRFVWGDFVALSYAWGDFGKRSDIVVNGGRVSVQKNLEGALRQLRDTKLIESGYLIWADALCIDQKNLHEKTLEVRRMRLIYRLAHDVVIWLGEEHHDSARAMDLIRVLSDSCLNNTDVQLGEALRSDPEHLGTGAWLAWSKLLERPYWSRLWVIQEMAMGGSHAPILCGDKVVSWAEFYRAAYTFGRHNTDVIFSCIDRERAAVGLRSFGLNRNKIIQIHDQHLIQAGEMPPKHMAILDLARKSASTDLRDKVYGILGLIDPLVAARVDISYTRSVDDVYTSFAQSYILGTNSLDILEHADFLGAIYLLGFQIGGRQITTGSSAATGPTRRADPHVRSVGSLSMVAGQAYFENDSSLSAELELQQSQYTSNAYGNEELLKDAVWRTFIANRTTKGLPAPADYACLLDQPIHIEASTRLPSRGARAFTRFVSQSSHLLIAGKPLASYFISKAQAFDSSSNDAVEKVWRSSRLSRLITTRSGRLGLGPHETLRSDKVAVILGCSVALLLRPTRDPGDIFHLVGACYIHGLMEGQALDGNQNAITIHIE